MKNILLLIVVMLLGSDGFDAGLRAYRENRFREALEKFSGEEIVAGERASAAVMYNRALAALQARELLVAEFSAEKAAARGGPAFHPLRDFLFGNTAFSRCAMAEAEADLPDPDPTALDRAIAHAATARDSWQRAAMSRPDWPAARRNVERALLKLAALKEKRDDALQKRKQAPNRPKPKLLVQPDAEGEADPSKKIEEETTLEPQLEELAAAKVRRLIDKLDEKTKEKRAVRKARREARNAQVEKDW